MTPPKQTEVKNFWTDESVCGGDTYTGLCLQITALERDTSEVLCLLRSMQNTFAPINRIPPDILSLIPDYRERLRYWDRWDADRGVVSLAYVCRGRKEVFTSRSSLRTHLDCKNSYKTDAYIERLRTLPLEAPAVHSDHTSFSNDAPLGLAPHTNRFGSLSLYLPSVPPG